MFFFLERLRFRTASFASFFSLHIRTPLLTHGSGPGPNTRFTPGPVGMALGVTTYLRGCGCSTYHHTRARSLAYPSLAKPSQGMVHMAPESNAGELATPCKVHCGGSWAQCFRTTSILALDTIPSHPILMLLVPSCG